MDHIDVGVLDRITENKNEQSGKYREDLSFLIELRIWLSGVD